MSDLNALGYAGDVFPPSGSRTLRVLYHAPMYPGGNCVWRAQALARMPEIALAISSFVSAGQGRGAERLARRVCIKLGIGTQHQEENSLLLARACEFRPHILFNYNCRGIDGKTVRQIRQQTGALAVYFSPDDVMAPHYFSNTMLNAIPEWDVCITTKSFGVAELEAMRARRVLLTSNIYEPEIHRPLTEGEVGPEFEQFDFVFVGTYENHRAQLIKTLARAGHSVLVHGNAAGRLAGGWHRLRHSNVECRGEVTGLEYTRAVHRGKVSLGLLRKVNRDLITHRSIELPAMGRAMLGEHTPEHDAVLLPGREYMPFRNPQELIDRGYDLLTNRDTRIRLGEAARKRCLETGYSSDVSMRTLLDQLLELYRERAARGPSS